ncbi:MAG: VWA domain-containing protein [Candidatus Binatia bacterium]|nr:MAG: VWA domain-containing protein [Candidatus Binatia bacterium]
MSPVGFSYLLSHPESASVDLEIPLLVLLLLAIPLFFLGARGRRTTLAAVLRAGAWSCLVAALAGLRFAVALPEQRMTIVGVVDVSESVGEAGRAWARSVLDRVAAALAPGDEFGLVTFAADPFLARVPSPPEPVRSLPVASSRGATNIAAGLDAALALLPPDTAHRLVLVTDGYETRGNVLRALARARELEAPVYVLSPPPSSEPDVFVESVETPAFVPLGFPFETRILVSGASSRREARLVVRSDGVPIHEAPIVLEKEKEWWVFPTRFDSAGSHTLEVEVHLDEDALPSNNRRSAVVTVGERPRALLVGESSSPLRSWIAGAGFQVRSVRPAEAPRRLPEVSGYHLVVFENVSRGAVPPETPGVLERYVREFGGGLLFLGGKKTFGDEGWKESPLASALPLTFEPQANRPKARLPLALMVLVDRSNSMGYSAFPKPSGSFARRDPAESKLHYAKAAALAVIAQLKDTDHVGVIAFDSQSFPIAPLEPLRKNRGRLEELIPRLVEAGGTDFYDALESARVQLSRSPLPKKHVILLTDGDTNRNAADHEPLIAALAEAGIGVTTIRIGDDLVNVELLHRISARTGGRFYHVRDVRRLPRLLLADTRTVLRGREEPLAVRPEADLSHPLLAGLPVPFPALEGYAFTRRRTGADLLLRVPSEERPIPLLAVWQYGLGRVGAVAASTASELREWGSWEANARFWSRLVRWAMALHVPGDFAVETLRREGKTYLRVRSLAPVAPGPLTARSGSEEILLAPVDLRVYEGRIEFPAEAVVLHYRDETGTVREVRRELPRIAAEPASEEFVVPRPNLELLRRIAEETGGKLDPTVREIVARERGTRRETVDLDFWLGACALVLFLADVGVRRLLPG